MIVVDALLLIGHTIWPEQYYVCQNLTSRLTGATQLVRETQFVTPARKGQYMTLHRNALQGQITA